jgi:FlaA1/EpsC-like NDP-sugar epimerase
MIVVGLLDDDRNLRGRYLYGHRVLGGIETVQRLVERHRVQDIVVTTKLEESVLRRLVGVASHTGAQLWFWEHGLRKQAEVGGEKEKQKAEIGNQKWGTAAG